MQLYDKFRAFVKKKPKSPEYTRSGFYIKLIQLYIYAVGMDYAGMKVFSIETKPIDFMYIWACTLNGLFMGLAVFRIFELYWWAKDMVNESYLIGV